MYELGVPSEDIRERLVDVQFLRFNLGTLPKLCIDTTLCQTELQCSCVFAGRVGEGRWTALRFWIKSFLDVLESRKLLFFPRFQLLQRRVKSFLLSSQSLRNDM